MNKKLAPPTAKTFTPRDVSLGVTRASDVAFPLSWGVFGTGEICRQFVCASREVAGATMAGVSSRHAENAHAFANAHGVVKAYDTYQDLLDAPDIDVVYVGTPDSVHKEHCLMALNAGKHVLCEKILATCVEDAQQMYAAAERHNVMLQDGVWSRFFPAMEQARHLLETGVIGDVVMVQADFDPLYTSQLVTMAFGLEAKPIDIKVCGTAGGPGGAILEFESNRFAILSFISYPSEFAEVFEIIGTEGRITLEQPAHCPTALTLRVPSVAPSRYLGGNTPSPLQRFEYPLPSSVRIPQSFPNQQGFYYMTEAIHRCLAAGLRQCPQFDRAESLHLLEIVCAINGLRQI